SVDAALGVALGAAGAPAGTATSAVLGYRIITAWLPALPAAVVLSALVRRKVV
ncbi:MAG: TIGR00374 family protein, partial [Streptomyces sp.]|nr:TIGR00374 family protein [Streptomyces sp.]